VVTITIEDFCIALYCAFARPDAFEPDDAQRIAFTARALDQGREDHFRAEFDQVREYSTRHEARPLGTGDQLEISAIEVSGKPGSWRVWINPFYMHEIEFGCSRILLNGAEVTGSGRHLQDDLPRRVADVPPYPAGAA